MRRHLLLLLAAVLIAPIAPTLLVTSAGAEEAPAQVTTQHPRLLFSAADVVELRERVAVPGSVHAAAWARVEERAERHLLVAQPELLRPGVCVPAEPIFLKGNYNGLECAYNLQNEMSTYLIELGMAYQLSGDERYGRRVVELLSALGDAGFTFWSGQDLGIGDMLQGVGLGFDWTAELMTPQERRKIVDDITAHQDLLFVRPLFEYTNEASTYPASNWMGVTAGGAGLALLAVRGEPGAPTTWTSPPDPAPANSNVPAWPERTYTFDEYLAKAMTQVRTYLRGGIDLEGASQEGTTYGAYALKNSIPFALAAKRDGLGDAMDPAGLPARHCWGSTQFLCLPLAASGPGSGLPKLSRWLAFEQLPGEGQNFVPLIDSQRTQAGVDLQALLFAINPDDGVAQWVWRRTIGELGTDYYGSPQTPPFVRDDKCSDPLETFSYAACEIFNSHGNVWTILFYRSPDQTPEVDPATTGPLTVHHAERGLIDARTGFDGEKREVVSTFEARRNGVAHFQYDLGNFTLYGEGGRFAVDPGFDCVGCKDDGTHLGGYADQHNVVVIDGAQRTQVPDSRYAAVDGTTIDRFVNTPNVSLAHADLRYAYGRNGGGGFISPYAGRDHLFSRVPGRPVILGISDHVQRDTATHAYRWQMLTNNDNIVTPEGTGFTIRQGVDGAVLAGRVAAGGSIAGDLPVQVRAQPITTSSDDQGKVFPVVYTETPKQLAMDQLAVMALTPAGETPASTETLRVSGGNAIAVTYKGVQDVVVRKLIGTAEVKPLPLLAGIETDAVIAKFMRDDAAMPLPSSARSAETVLRAGRRLAAYGRSYVTVTGSAATVTVSGSEVGATGAATNTYRVYAPQSITKVTVNGAAAASCRTGDYLTFPCVRPTALAVSAPTSAPATDALTAAAVLTSEGAGLPGRAVRFAVGGLTADAVTDGSGVARAVLRLDLDAGLSELTATYAGDLGYAVSSASSPLQVTRDVTAVQYTGETSGRGDTVAVSAVLTEDEGVPMQGRPVTFTLLGRVVVATTDAAGRAQAVMSAPDHGRSQAVTVSFAATPRHAASTAAGTVTWGAG